MSDVVVVEENGVPEFIVPDDIKGKAVHFERGYYYAAQYREREGHLFVESREKFAGFDLGCWLASRRHERKKEVLPQERITRLDAIDMIWDVQAGKFQMGLYSAKRYFAIHGHCNAPKAYMDLGFPLGLWLINQRRAMKAGSLNDQAIKDLEELGMLWTLAGEKPQISKKNEEQGKFCNHA